MTPTGLHISDSSTGPVALGLSRPTSQNRHCPVNMSSLPDVSTNILQLCLGVPEAIAFLQEIGIPVQIVPTVSPASFLEEVEVVDGSLRITPSCRASSLLHEAGHIACVPAPYRRLLSGNLYKGLRAMYELVRALDVDPDSPLMRAVIQCSDPEATAWAWAAGVHLGLPAELIIMDDEYDGEGADIRFCLQASSYLGINGLMHAGMCQNPRRPGGFPVLRTWLQDVAVPTDCLPWPAVAPSNLARLHVD